MSHAEQAKSPTGLTDERWQVPRKLLPQPSRRGAPRTVGSGGLRAGNLDSQTRPETGPHGGLAF
jgi:hypothetical protein